MVNIDLQLDLQAAMEGATIIKFTPTDPNGRIGSIHDQVTLRKGRFGAVVSIDHTTGGWRSAAVFDRTEQPDLTGTRYAHMAFTHTGNINYLVWQADGAAQESPTRDSARRSARSLMNEMRKERVVLYGPR